jgi:hypothetical protein
MVEDPEHDCQAAREFGVRVPRDGFRRRQRGGRSILTGGVRESRGQGAKGRAGKSRSIKSCLKSPRVRRGSHSLSVRSAWVSR